MWHLNFGFAQSEMCCFIIGNIAHIIENVPLMVPAYSCYITYFWIE